MAKGITTKGKSPTKAPAKKKVEEKVTLTRVQSIAAVMKNGTQVKGEILAKSDAAYAKATGRKLNPNETRWVFSMVRQTLLAFGLAEDDGDKLVLKKGGAR